MRGLGVWDPLSFLKFCFVEAVGVLWDHGGKRGS